LLAEASSRSKERGSGKSPGLENAPTSLPERGRIHTFTLVPLYFAIFLAVKNGRSLIFLGLVIHIQTSIYVDVSAVLGLSWMEVVLDISKSKEEMDYEIARVNVWIARRYLFRGRTRQIASEETQDVTDFEEGHWSEIL
jgi:hypothetical protein